MFVEVLDWSALGNGRFTYETAWVEMLRTDPEGSTPTYMVQTLFTPSASRGKGYGSEIMRRLVELADRNGCTLVLKAASFDNSALDDARLVKFYCEFGFTVVDSRNNWMERVPNGGRLQRELRD